MNPLYTIDRAMASTIREILNTDPTCQKCGAPEDDCKCSIMGEDDAGDEEETKEPSGDQESIIINPEIETNAAKNRQVDEWSKAAGQKFLNGK